MRTPTTPIAYSGSGWSSGIAAQVSLPSILASRLLHSRSPSRAGGPLRTRHGPLDDALEELLLHRAIGPRRDGNARLCQFGIGGIVECRPGAAHLGDPGVEIAAGHRLGDEAHIGKAVAAEHCRKARKFARLVGEQVEVGGHAAHRVDLAAEL